MKQNVADFQTKEAFFVKSLQRLDILVSRAFSLSRPPAAKGPGNEGVVDKNFSNWDLQILDFSCPLNTDPRYKRTVGQAKLSVISLQTSSCQHQHARGFETLTRACN